MEITLTKGGIGKLKCGACGFTNDDENQRYCYKCGKPLVMLQDDTSDGVTISENRSYEGFNSGTREDIKTRMAQRQELRMKRNEAKKLRYSHIRTAVLAALIAIILGNSAYIIYCRIQLGRTEASEQTLSVETTNDSLNK